MKENEKQKEKQFSGRPDCRILFSDIDGTLLNSSHQIPEKTRRKILELEQRGIHFILVSARMPDGVRVIQRALGNHSPIVCYSGGLILDENGEQMYNCQMKLDQAVEIKQALKKYYPDICCNTYGMDKWVVDDDQNPWVRDEERITEGKSMVGRIEELFAADGGIHKFLLMGKPEDITAAAQMLTARYPELTVQRSKPDYLEVMNGNVKKSAGVRLLCRRYGIPEEQAAAFGDGENDIDMIRAVKYGFAMANAPETVRRQAAFVTLSNDEEGILEVIRAI